MLKYLSGFFILITVGCTIPSWDKKPVGKGESSELNVLFTPNSTGAQLKTIMVRHNKSEHPVKLLVKATVK